MLAAMTSLAEDGLIGDAVICKSVSAKGQAVSPGAWFPSGTKSLTVWFRTFELAQGTKAEVRWLLNGTSLSTRERTLVPNRFGFDRYALGIEEPLPTGTYEAMILLAGGVQARARARVGGTAPARPDVTAISPTESPYRARSAGLKRSNRSPGAETAAPPTIAPSAGITATPTESASAPEAPPAAEVISPDGIARPRTTSAEMPKVPGAVEALTPGGGATAAPSTRSGSASVSGGPPEAPTLPTAVESARTKSGGPGTIVVPGSAAPPATMPIITIPMATSPSQPSEGWGLAAPTIGGLEPSAAKTPTAAGGPGETETPEGDAISQKSTPLGPRTATEVAAKPILSRPGSQSEAARAPATTVRRPSFSGSYAAASRTAIPRTSAYTAAVGPVTASKAAPLVASSQSDARISRPTAEKLLSSSGSRDDTSGADRAGATAIRPERSDTSPEAGSAVEQAPAPTTSGQAPGTAPGSAATTPGIPVETAPPPSAPPTPAAASVGGSGASEDSPVTEGPPPSTTPATPEGPGRATEDTSAPSVELGPIALSGPLVAEIVAEDLPGVELPKDAVKLYHVDLAPVPEPAGIQPLWVMRVPDGRLWPPGMPTQLGLHAGQDPTPTLADLLLYSDHIDGITPLYEVPRQEALLHAARDNDAAVLFMAREMYDERKAAWQAPAQAWRWMWYVRQVDLAPGDTVVACLVTVKRSARAPEGFEPSVEESVLLLDEAGNRVAARPVSAEMTRHIAPDLGVAASGLVPQDASAFVAGIKERGVLGLSAWTAPAAGRYQVWAAVAMDKCRAKCMVWRTGG